ncbi:Holliday junction resolvase RuvX [Echinicola sp. 20G]|uniref:Holliday junction resolvase RuvX n=1 Tax=Echinicola sp. 20G TaxID=2781961 RepID=UPI001910F85C|nr:Holliday junction resolvase RuvX [Echinicola sp. 20G]
MGRILAIDLGTKRTGIAVTDILKITANPLETIRTMDLDKFLKDYFAKEEVEAIVVGFPKSMDGSDTNMTQPTIKLKEKLAAQYADKKVVLVDERFTSKLAMQSMITMGSKKKDRKEKAGNLDKISAAIILQTYLEQI